MNTPAIHSRPSILLVANYSNRTGYAWNNIYRLFERIAIECHELGLSSLVSFEEFEPPLTWKQADIFEGVLELPPKPNGVQELWSWIRMIRSYKIRYLYLTDQANWSFYYGLFRLAGIRKIIVHNRISVPNYRPATPEHGLSALLKWCIYRIPFIQATRIYAVSDFVRNRLIIKARIPSKRVVTILNGVDLVRFAPHEINNQPRPVRIFCGGRATKHKGIGVLIEATALLRDQYGLSNFEVYYAGNGPDFSVFMELAENLELGERFQFLGELPTTELLLKNSDIVVVPSIWGDACPSAISEALATGKPLIATRVGGVPELIGDECVATIVDPGNSAELAEAIARLIKNPDERKILARRGRRRAEQALDQQRYYREVISQLRRDMNMDSQNK